MSKPTTSNPRNINIIRTPIAIAFILRELDLFLSFTWRDWSATLIPGFIIALGATKNASLPILHTIKFLPWVSTYVYFFNLSNQITGLEEDRINKPDRPIVSGKISLEGAKRRWVASLACFLGIAMWNGKQIPETLTWIATVAFLSLTRGGGHWFGKNTIAMTTGTWALLNGVHKTIAVPTPEFQRFNVVVSLWVGEIIQIQDLRDVKGDKAIGRSTLPVVLGESQSRVAITFFLLPLSYWILWVGGVAAAAPALLLVAHAALGYRVMVGKGAKYDHLTYMWFTYLCCGIFTIPIWSDLR